MPMARALARHLAAALPALAVPVVVLVGIYGGIVTVTEAAAIAAVVALLVSLLFYRGFHWTQHADRDRRRHPQRRHHHADRRHRARLRPLDDRVAASRPAGEIHASTTTSRTWEFLLAINVLLLVLGCFLEVTATLLLVLPILAPALKPLGVDPVHFSIIFTHNMEIGLIHPPVGLNLYVLSTISHAPIGEVIRGILPFLILLLIVLGDHHLRAGAHPVAAERRVRLRRNRNPAGSFWP